MWIRGDAGHLGFRILTPELESARSAAAPKLANELLELVLTGEVRDLLGQAKATRRGVGKRWITRTAKGGERDPGNR